MNKQKRFQELFISLLAEKTLEWFELCKNRNPDHVPVAQDIFGTAAKEAYKRLEKEDKSQCVCMIRGCTDYPKEEERTKECECGSRYCEHYEFDNSVKEGKEEKKECEHEMGITIHGKCGGCNQQMNITGVGHVKDESCCQPPEKEEPRWRASKGEYYSFIDLTHLTFISIEESGSLEDEMRWNSFNYFKDDKEAYRMLEKIKQVLSNQHP